MADAYSAGLTFRDLLGKAVPAIKDAALNAISPGTPFVQAATSVAAPTIHDFLAGAINGPQNSITMQLPPATPVAGAVKASAPAALGQLSPAAAAVIANANSTSAKPAAAGGKTPAAADPLGALGNLSFRQLLTLSQASQNLTPRGSTRPVPTADAAGNLLLQMTMPQFQNTLKEQKTDADKQKVIDNYRDQVLLPIISHGNPMSGMFDPNGGGGG